MFVPSDAICENPSRPERVCCRFSPRVCMPIVVELPFGARLSLYHSFRGVVPSRRRACTVAPSNVRTVVLRRKKNGFFFSIPLYTGLVEDGETVTKGGAVEPRSPRVGAPAGEEGRPRSGAKDPAGRSAGDWRHCGRPPGDLLCLPLDGSQAGL